MWRTLVLFCIIVTVRGDDGEWREIKTPQGPVRGRKDPAGLYTFSNIPYATVPKGPHKFSEPLPAPAWLQPLEVPEKHIICPQNTPELANLKNVLIQEDCLIANVYVPDTDEKQLPVLVYIHGGAFQLGFGDMITPKNLVKEKNIIVVTFNYRLGVHGFLCLGTNAAPGNAGLKDQVALLRWVKKNIASYGGNPEKVTIAGYSAGSVSVDFLILAKSAKGLFNNAILESGVNVGSIALQTDPLENAKKHAQSLNFNNVDNIYDLEEFYKSSPLDSLIGNYTFFERKDASLLFGPCIERKSSSAFIDEPPVQIIKNGKYKKVPILLGISNMEGLLHLHLFDIWKNEMNENFTSFLPADLHFENVAQKEEIAKVVKEFYFGNKLVNDDSILSYIDYLSDIYFGYSTLRSVRLHAENGHKEVYLYEYSFVDNHTSVVPHTEVRGAGHCAQTVAVLDGHGFSSEDKTRHDESDLSEEFVQMKATMRELWYNFVVHGKPVTDGSELPAWPPAGVNGSPHMSLGQTIKLKGPLLESRANFWEQLYKKYYRHPISPPAPPHSEL